MRNFSAYQALDVASLLDACASQPRYSLVVPVFRTDLKLLRRCIASVQSQLYANWELILVDDGSQMPELTAELAAWAQREPRIRVCTLDKNRGIAGATNHGIAQARGAWVGFLDHDDELTPDALLWMVVAHNRHPRSRWFYSDEATLQPDGSYAGRFHRKPDFSWEYLLAVNYTCHFSVYERKLLDAVGGLRTGFDGAQDHDLALRISERVRADEVTHIPQVLYFWRATPQSTANSLAAKPAAGQAAYQAVIEAIEHRGLSCSIMPDPDLGTRFQLQLRPRSTPKVTILIPTRNATSMVQHCIESLVANTSYPNYEIVVIDNQSDDPQLARYLAELETSGRGRTLRYNQPFNHSDMHNQAIAELDCELVVFLNNDVYDFSPGWLEQFVATIELDETIAGAGAKLFYPDGTIQHGGIVIGSAGGLAEHVDCQQPGNTPGYYGRSRALQQVSGVTAALMIMRKAPSRRSAASMPSAIQPATTTSISGCVWARPAIAACSTRPCKPCTKRARHAACRLTANSSAVCVQTCNAERGRIDSGT